MLLFENLDSLNPLQFIAARKNPVGPPTVFVVWADLTKFGRMDNKQLNWATGIIEKALSKTPAKSIAIVIAPHLTSEKVSNGSRGEIRSLGHHESIVFAVICLFFLNLI